VDFAVPQCSTFARIIGIARLSTAVMCMAAMCFLGGKVIS
jgi:hypothetical protein